MIALGVGGGLHLYGEHTSDRTYVKLHTADRVRGGGRHRNGIEKQAVFQNKTTRVAVWVVFRFSKRTK